METDIERNIPATAWKKQAVNVESPVGFKVTIFFLISSTCHCRIVTMGWLLDRGYVVGVYHNSNFVLSFFFYLFCLGLFFFSFPFAFFFQFRIIMDWFSRLCCWGVSQFKFRFVFCVHHTCFWIDWRLRIGAQQEGENSRLAGCGQRRNFCEGQDVQVGCLMR